MFVLTDLPQNVLEWRDFLNKMANCWVPQKADKFIDQLIKSQLVKKL
jgi:hypothetical protein